MEINNISSNKKEQAIENTNKLINFFKYRAIAFILYEILFIILLPGCIYGLVNVIKNQNMHINIFLFVFLLVFLIGIVILFLVTNSYVFKLQHYIDIVIDVKISTKKIIFFNYFFFLFLSPILSYRLFKTAKIYKESLEIKNEK